MPTQTELTRREAYFSYPLEDWPLAESYDVGPLVIREVRRSTPSRGGCTAIAPVEGSCEHLCEQLAHINQTLHQIAAGLRTPTPEKRVSVKPRSTSGCSVYRSAPVCILTSLKATSNEASETPVAADPSGSVSPSVVSRGVTSASGTPSVVSRGVTSALGTPRREIGPTGHTTSSSPVHQSPRPAGQSTFLVVHKSHILARNEQII